MHGLNTSTQEILPPSISFHPYHYKYLVIFPKLSTPEKKMATQASKESGNKIDYFDMLPEGCLADTLAHTTPTDACRLALVAPAFRSIADSNGVWERFLPCDYSQLISRAVPAHRHVLDHLALSPKKKLYLFLCDNPLVIDNGTLVIFSHAWCVINMFWY